MFNINDSTMILIIDKNIYNINGYLRVWFRNECVKINKINLNFLSIESIKFDR